MSEACFLQLQANTLDTEKKKMWGQKHACARCLPVDQEVMRSIVQVWVKDSGITAVPVTS